MWSALAAAVSYLPMAFVTVPWQLLFLNGLAGMAIGGIMPTLSALLTAYSRGANVASAFGLDNSMTSASRAVAPLVGLGVSAWFGFASVFVAGSLIFVATLVVSALLLPHPSKR